MGIIVPRYFTFSVRYDLTEYHRKEAGQAWSPLFTDKKAR